MTYRRCAHYEGRARCPNEATHAFTVNGEILPMAGYTCEAHGRAVVDEYTAKLPREGWSLAALTPKEP
jgi:hypothetical protein